MSARDRTVIGVMLIAAFVVILNETIMAVALPRLMTDLGISAGTGQWLTTAFMLTMAVLIPATGFVLQRLTTRTVFILALALFSAGTLVGGVAPGFVVLLIGRIVQASGTAVMIPLLMTTVLNLVPPQRRGSFMGTISIVIAVAPAIGPTVSGLILQFLSWRFMFFAVLPIALIALGIGYAKLTNVGEKSHRPLDVLSVVLTVPAFGLLVFGLNQFGEGGSGGSPVLSIGSLVVGVIFLLAFGRRQISLRHSDNALLDLRVFRYSAFRKSLAVIVLAMMGLFGMILLLPIYLQKVHGLSTLLTGLLMLPGGILMAIMGPIVGRLYDRYGPKGLMMIGTGLVTTMLITFALSSESTPLWLLAVQYAILMGGGMGLTMTPAMTNGLNPLPPHLYSHGSATLMTVQQVAAAAGTAALISIMAVRTLMLTSTGVPELDAQLSGLHASFLAGAVATTGAFVLAIFIRRAVPIQPDSVAAQGDPIAAEGKKTVVQEDALVQENALVEERGAPAEVSR